MWETEGLLIKAFPAPIGWAERCLLKKHIEKGSTYGSFKMQNVRRRYGDLCR